MKGHIITVCLLTLAIGCGAVTRLPPEPPHNDLNKSISLNHFKSCGDFDAAIKAWLIKKMEKDIEQYNRSRCQYEYYNSGDGGPSAGPPIPYSTESEANYTDTNVQEQGVDEADTIKSNGEYLFVAANNGLEIIKIWPFDQFAKVATIPIEGGPISLYLAGKKALVFSTSPDSWKTKLTFVDVSNPVSPTVVRESIYEGTLIDSRRINNMLHLVMQTFLKVPSLSYWVEDSLLPSCKNFQEGAVYPQVEQTIARLKEENRKTIEEWVPSQSLPGIKHHLANMAASSQEITRDSCNNVSYSGAVAGHSLMELISINTEDISGDDKITAVVDNGDNGSGVYASKEALYVAGLRNQWNNLAGENNDEETVIHRFNLGDGGKDTSYHGSGTVPGHLLNQFSLSEFDGFLRVATTIGHVSRDGQSAVSNNVYTLDIKDSALPIRGKIKGMAEGEQIYAVRFIGPRGFVVTFKKIDPLFTLDLSDPANPQVAGELKVPGFSTYLHPLDEDTLIGLGEDAEDMGTFAWFQGIQLSLFDVGNPANPTRTQNTIIGSRGTNSSALYDHHAFTFDTKRSLISLPIELHTGGGGGNDYGTYQYSGLQLYRVSRESGFNLIGEIKRDDAACNDYPCWDLGFTVQRSIIIGDDSNKGIVVLWDDQVALYNLDDAMTLLGSVPVYLSR